MTGHVAPSGTGIATPLDRAAAPIAVAGRSGFEESVHHGVAVAIDAGGRMTACVGDPATLIYPRSTLKPLQAAAMVAIGLDLDAEGLALACASHDGAPVHLATVRRILESYDLDESDLANTPSRPLDATARARARSERIEPSALQQNCSGKHAAMLATCKINGWTIDDYLDPRHPLQQAITTSIAAAANAVHHVGVDGCGAPTHVVGLRDLAAAVGALARSGGPVPAAMRAHPELVAGPTRDVTVAMRAVPGLLMKDGAQGVTVAAMPDGRAVAVKIADGSDVGRRAVTVAALGHIGVELPAEVVARLAVPVLGGGVPVGEITALDWTACSS